MLQGYVVNQGNGWQLAIEELLRYFERATALPLPLTTAAAAAAWMRSDGEAPEDVREVLPNYLAGADVLGRRTGEMHLHLAEDTGDPAFTSEALTAVELKGLAEAMRGHADTQLRLLDAHREQLEGSRRELADQVRAMRSGLLKQFDALACVEDGGRSIRVHGDYHLGQVLVTEGDFVILDFEGEPARPLAERRLRSSPVRDVAGMLRSFSYAVLTALDVTTRARPDDRERLAPWAALWESWVSAAFVRAYLRTTAGSPMLPSRHDTLDQLLRAFMLDKAVYELGYELNNRPDWVHIPLQGILASVR
jgi:maltose alpha-D-glucosyltransferase/alpha-amylase